jgi:Family of unknown function (DUF5946)
MDGDRLAQATYHELSYYTLAHPDPAFIHQHAVDAFGAQYAHENDKPIRTAFSLIGLYLCVDKGYSGKNVQRVHALLARRRKQWPTFKLPESRGKITIHDVMDAAPGPTRDEMIQRWCASVWDAYVDSHAAVVQLVVSELG